MRRRLNALLICMSLLGIVILSAPVSARAETRYVSDTLVITMRTGAGDEYKIIKTLKTGTAMEVLDESASHLKVKVADGTEGWVLKQYVTTETPKETVIGRLSREVDRLKGEAEKLARERSEAAKSLSTEKARLGGDLREVEKNLKERTGQVADLTRQLKELTAKHDRLLKDSGDVVEVVAERDRLSEDNSRLSAENDALTKRTDRLKRRSAVYWFLAGGAVLLVGWLLGQISKKRKSSFYSF